MLDSAEYRHAEAAAKAQLPSWWIAQTHHVDQFEKIGFPVRPSYCFEIGQLLDTMQENRFGRFAAELNGFSEDAHDDIVCSLASFIEFCLIYFPRRRPILPVSTMLSAYLLHKKIDSLISNDATILEVGPGCGYFAFFAALNAKIKDYSQIESAESFYILQNRINGFLYRDRFVEHAHSTEKAESAITFRKDFESNFVDIDRSNWISCSHYPWWKIGMVAAKTGYFDIVTSNANLLEFSAPALRDYLLLFNLTLKPTGYFIVNCTGFPASGTLETLLTALHEFKFAPLLCSMDNDDFPVDAAAAGVFGRPKPFFALNNLLMVKEGHPLYDSAYSRGNFRHGFYVDCDAVRRAYSQRPWPGRWDLKQFIAEAVNTYLSVRRRDDASGIEI